MKILLCNDDGFRALGITTLARVLIEAGHDVTVVAPSEERSGQSHAVSFFRPMLVHKVSEKLYSVHGTPADCAIVGLDLLSNTPPDIVLSGINHGLNVGWDVNYSGTVGAATEATMLGYRAMALSVDLHNKADYQKAFEHCAYFAVKVLKSINDISWPRFEVLNINHPGFEPRGVSVAECGGVNLYRPALERLPTKNLPFPNASIFMVGGSERMSSTEPGHDVTLIQAGHVTMSFVQSRQSSTENTRKLENLLPKFS